MVKYIIDEERFAHGVKLFAAGLIGTIVIHSNIVSGLRSLLAFFFDWDFLVVVPDVYLYLFAEIILDFFFKAVEVAGAVLVIQSVNRSEITQLASSHLDSLGV